MTARNKKRDTFVTESVLAIVGLLSAGTFIFNQLEGWSIVDSFYFTGATLLTIGYGDLVPTTDLSKILVVVFGFLAIGTFLYALSFIGAAVHAKLPGVIETANDLNPLSDNGDKKGKK